MRRRMEERRRRGDEGFRGEKEEDKSRGGGKR